FDEEHIALFVETNFVRFIERRRRGRSAVAGIAFLANAGDGRDDAVPINFANNMIHRVADIKRAIWPSRDAEGVVELRFRGLSAAPGLPRRSCAGESFDTGL